MTITTFLNKLNTYILNPIIGLLFALSFAYFVYGIVRFISLDYGDKAKDEAKSAILWGIFGMIVMFSVYGLIRFVLDATGTPTSEVSKYIPI